jgi:hypothetical protein
MKGAISQLLGNVQLFITQVAAISCAVRNNHLERRFRALPRRACPCNVLFMMQRLIADFVRCAAALCGLLIFSAAQLVKADPPAGAVTAFNNYAGALESRLA